MALPSFCRETVDVYRAPIKDSRGTQIRDWDNQTKTTITGCTVQPSSTSTDMTEARAAVHNTAIGYFPPGTDIAKGDIVEWQGIKYLVDGSPMPMASPSGAVSHVRVNLTEWEG